MKIDGKAYRSVWPSDDGAAFHILDQTKLPHDFVTLTVRSEHDAAHAITTMQVRGAPLIGAYRSYCGGHRMNVAVLEALFKDHSNYAVVEAGAPRLGGRAEAAYAALPAYSAELN